MGVEVDYAQMKVVQSKAYHHRPLHAQAPGGKLSPDTQVGDSYSEP